MTDTAAPTVSPSWADRVKDAETAIVGAIERLKHIRDVSGCDLDETCPHGIPCSVAGPLVDMLDKELQDGRYYPGTIAVAFAVMSGDPEVIA